MFISDRLNNCNRDTTVVVKLITANTDILLTPCSGYDVSNHEYKEKKSIQRRKVSRYEIVFWSSIYIC